MSQEVKSEGGQTAACASGCAGRGSAGYQGAGVQGPMMPGERVRPAAVAGFFYPADPAELRAKVVDLLATAARRQAGGGGRLPAVPKAIIAPHAGYVYSGPIAANAFATLAGDGGRVEDQSARSRRVENEPPGRVVLVGPSHRVPLRGLGLPGAERFATPLGEVALDMAAMDALARLPQVSVRPDAHAEEHSLEVELPFLQVALGRFSLVPLVAGEASGEEVAAVLEAVWGGPETVLVISSDLSHYLPAERAEEVDRDTAAHIQALAGPLTPRRACGAVPINGLLEVARRRQLAPRLLDLRHSGDTSGDRSRVVGYGAWAFDEHVS